MIIFDLDGTLADCEHRRHFVDSSSLGTREDYEKWIRPFIESKTCPSWEPDWKSFYEACDGDKPIEPVIEIMLSLRTPYEVWSGRCESVRKKTENWLCQFMNRSEAPGVKMRPIGDSTPDDQLKERWLDEYISSMWPKLDPVNEQNDERIYRRKDPIDFVFDSDPKSIVMWRRRGVFVFDCGQRDGEV